MNRLIIFMLLALLVGWIFAYSMSGKNKRRALLGIGKVAALLVIVALIVSILIIL